MRREPLLLALRLKSPSSHVQFRVAYHKASGREYPPNGERNKMAGLVGLLVCLWLVCWFVCWLVGLLVGWFVGLLVCWVEWGLPNHQFWGEVSLWTQLASKMMFTKGALRVQTSTSHRRELSLSQPNGHQLDCYWVGSLDFTFFGKSRGFPLNPKSQAFCRGVNSDQAFILAI